MAAVQHELNALAASKMRQERRDHTLQPTALVNEAFLRLVGDAPEWSSRAHFFGAASEAMRRVLIDHARRHRAQKRGGDASPVTFNDIAVDCVDPDMDLLALDEALNHLDAMDQRLGSIVRLRYFVGLTVDETARVLQLSPMTVKRDWAYARAWLLERILGDTD